MKSASYAKMLTSKDLYYQVFEVRFILHYCSTLIASSLLLQHPSTHNAPASLQFTINFHSAFTNCQQKRQQFPYKSLI